MRTRYRTALAILVVAVVAWLGKEALHPREPSYQGKRLTEWLDEYNQAGSMDKIGPVSEAIRAMGTNSLPFLLAHIEHTDSWLRNAIFRTIRRLSWAKLPFYGTDRYRCSSILALSALGSHAAPLCSQLLKGSEEPAISWGSQMSLLAIGPASIPTLAKICQSTNLALRTAAVLKIAKLRVMPPPWFSWAWDKDPGNGRPIFGLGSVVSNQEVEELVKLLEYPDPAVRCASACALSQFVNPPYNQAAKSAINPLLQALQDADLEVRLSASNALKVIDPVAAVKAGLN